MMYVGLSDGEAPCWQCSSIMMPSHPFSLWHYTNQTA